MLRLDARLQAVKALVRPGAVAADIGCDHGKLICSLAQSGVITRGFACDANSGPLENAKKTIRETRLGDMIEAVLTDGLNGLPHRDIDTFIIAGMGGELIAEIMLSHSWIFDTRFDFILQPMTRAEVLRQRLLENGFNIEKERAVISDNRVYTVMHVKYTESNACYDEITLYTGRLLEDGSFAAQKYLEGVIKRLRKKPAQFFPLAEEIQRRMEKYNDVHSG
jgi:tRNA (adenine22-N1)-methyltransferase